MAEQVGCGTPCLLWSLGVWEVVGSRPGRAIVGIVFHRARKLVRFFLFWNALLFQILNSEIVPWGSVSYRPYASPSYEASSHVNTVQITFIFIGQTHLVFGKRVCTCVTKHSNAFRTFLNWLKNSKRVWHERKLHILRLPIFANFDLWSVSVGWV